MVKHVWFIATSIFLIILGGAGTYYLAPRYLEGAVGFVDLQNTPQAHLFQAPVFRSTTTAGTETWRGRVVVLGFWTSWNPVARAHVPVLDRLQKIAGESARVAAINSQESPEVIAQSLSETSIGIPILLDEGGTIGEVYEIGMLPLTIIVDQSGFIRERIVGPITEYELEARIRLL